MEIKQENIIAAYNTADDNGKRIIAALFGEEVVQAATTSDKRPVTERIKTFEDACKELGEEHLFVKQYNSNEMADVDTDLDAYLKLRIICAALNEGWKPQFIENEYRWYPWFNLYTQEEIDNKDDDWKQGSRQVIDTGDYETEFDGFTYSDSRHVPSYSSATVGSRLCLKSEALATYCGTQFTQLWANFNLIRK